MDRRGLIKGVGGAAVASAFAGWQRVHADGPVAAEGFGPLRPDPGGVFDLPEGFGYRIIARDGETMADGLLRPARPDGMAAFPGPDGRVVLVCNHENSPEDTANGAFGSGLERLQKAHRDRLFDAGDAGVGQGGTTTMVYDPASGLVERQFLSLGGTERNCAGGPTPWGSWLSCEESVARAGELRTRDHGWVFDVPAQADGGLIEAQPLTALGRFNHEAAAVSADRAVIYMTEDRGDGLFYRAILAEPGNPAAGARLQALALPELPGADTRNWNGSRLPVGETRRVAWIDLDHTDAPEDDLRIRGHAAGAALFARGEGLWAGDGAFYFACTSGGPAEMGQVFRYIPEGEGGQLELMVESDGRLLRNADNLTVAPWGDLLVCEDTDDHCGLIGVTPEGALYPFARNLYTPSELAGACFAPDGRTLFVNIQKRGLTLAITGPFPGA